jgi:hypothetical protein
VFARGSLRSVKESFGLKTLLQPERKEAVRMSAQQRESSRQLTSASNPFRLWSPAEFV